MIGSAAGRGGDYGSGLGGCEVYAAAAEIVEMFLGDFVPAVRSRSPVSAVTAAAAQEEGGGGGTAASAAASSRSRWKTIGQGGRLSARALAMCAKEVK